MSTQQQRLGPGEGLTGQSCRFAREETCCAKVAPGQYWLHMRGGEAAWEKGAQELAQQELRYQRVVKRLLHSVVFFLRDSPTRSHHPQSLAGSVCPKGRILAVQSLYALRQVSHHAHLCRGHPSPAYQGHTPCLWEGLLGLSATNVPHPGNVWGPEPG